MKKKIALTFAALVVACSSPLALANPVGVEIDVFCPQTQYAFNMLSNYGDFIAGYGSENVGGQDTQIYFKSNTSVKGVPTNLDQYTNAEVAYASTTGNVTCSYMSNDGTPSFKIIYTLINGKGGQVFGASSNSITVEIPLGAKHNNA